MPRGKKTAKAQAAEKAKTQAVTVAKGGERLIVLNKRHRYKIWGDGPKDQDGNKTNKLLCELTFGENLIDAEAWAAAQRNTGAKNALAQGTMRDAGEAAKGYKAKKPKEAIPGAVEVVPDDKGDEDKDGGEGSD